MTDVAFSLCAVGLLILYFISADLLFITGTAANLLLTGAGIGEDHSGTSVAPPKEDRGRGLEVSL